MGASASVGVDETIDKVRARELAREHWNEDAWESLANGATSVGGSLWNTAVAAYIDEVGFQRLTAEPESARPNRLKLPQVTRAPHISPMKRRRRPGLSDRNLDDESWCVDGDVTVFKL